MANMSRPGIAPHKGGVKEKIRGGRKYIVPQSMLPGQFAGLAKASCKVRKRAIVGPPLGGNGGTRSYKGRTKNLVCSSAAPGRLSHAELTYSLIIHGSLRRES